HASPEPGVPQDAAREDDGERCARVRQGALQVRNPTAAQYRAEEEYDCAHLRGDCAPPGGVSGARRTGPETDDDQGGGRGDRGASFDGEPGRGQQVCAYAAGRLRAALLFHRGGERAGGRRPASVAAETQGEEA